MTLIRCYCHWMLMAVLVVADEWMKKKCQHHDHKNNAIHHSFNQTLTHYAMRVAADSLHRRVVDIVITSITELYTHHTHSLLYLLINAAIQYYSNKLIVLHLISGTPSHFYSDWATSCELIIPNVQTLNFNYHSR